MPPPPRKGGIDSSSSARPHSTPMPEGPKSLWPRERVEVAAERLHVDAQVRHRLRAVHDQSARRARGTAAAIARSGSTVPSTFETCVIATSFVRGESSASKASRRSTPRSSIGATRSAQPRRSHSSCQGTMFEWCSISESTISSPGPSARAVAVRHQVDRLGGVAHEDDLARVARRRGSARPARAPRRARASSAARARRRRGARWRSRVR